MLVILLIFVFIRPFISSLAFPYLNFVYSLTLLGFLITWFIRKGIQLGKIKALKFPLLLFFLALIISVIFSKDKINSLNELYKYISGILIFLVVIYLTYEDKIRIIKTIILAGFIISILAIYQYFFGFQHILDYLSKNHTSSEFALDYVQRRRVFFPFITPNTLAGYLAMNIPLILALWNKNKKNFLNPFFFILISVSLALLLTKSISALLSIFLSLVIYFYLQGILDKKRLAILTGFLITIATIVFLRQTAAKQHVLPTFSLLMRLNYWKDTLGIIKAKPLTGIGMGNFNIIQSRYAHNSYLQIWAEMGILGLVSLLWLIIIVVKSAIKNIKIYSNKKLIISLIAANAVFLIHNLVDFGFFLPEVSLTWWVILGLSALW